jgi:alpha-amylase/alpha-mannosidase (GH57 family)
LITLNILWHMHQPDYRQPAGAGAILPWVRLHAVKGYLDLLAIFKRYPQARCTVNFSGILLEQLQQLAEGVLTDQYEELSAKPALELNLSERGFLLRYFFSARTKTMIESHLRYRQLLDKRQSLVRLEGWDGAVERFTDQELTDLMVWFNLAWVGFTGQQHPIARSLISRGRDYNHADQRAVLELHRELVGQVLPGYRELAGAGQIELSCTPYHHPILPLLCDLAEGHRDDGNPLPQFRYVEDAREQVRRGMACYQHCFGSLPQGMWPAEGSVSDLALGVLAGEGIRWAATDQQNLPDGSRGSTDHLLPRLWSRDGSALHIFFRDTRLSDNIGFEYSSWPAAVAAAHMLQMVHGLAALSSDPQPVVTVALDGENPWESYPDGGEGFLSALFEGLAQDGSVQCSYPSEIIARRDWPQIGGVSAGSWIFGNFDIWSRHPETRQAWRMLAKARRELMDVAQGAVLDHLLAAEGSDWFWWYGDDFDSEEQDLFDQLFRGHLIAAYEAAGRQVPDELYVTIVTQHLPEAIGEASALIHPKLDGRVSSYFEWLGALQAGAHGPQGAMARGAGSQVQELWYGFSEDSLFLRIHLAEPLLDKLRSGGGEIVLTVSQSDVERQLRYTLPPGGARSEQEVALDTLVELQAGLAQAGLPFGAVAYLALEIQLADGSKERYPATGLLPIRVISADYAERNWFV